MANDIRTVNPLARIIFACHVAGMDTLHEHAAPLDALGKTLVTRHYNITDRAWQKWRKGGVPKIHWNSLDLLAQTNGRPVPRLGSAA